MCDEHEELKNAEAASSKPEISRYGRHSPRSRRSSTIAGPGAAKPRKPPLCSVAREATTASVRAAGRKAKGKPTTRGDI
jgi:hypothetical protein